MINHTTTKSREDAIRQVRRALGVRANTTVVIDDYPNAAPRYLGHGWRYETRGGTIIQHPGAYRKHGWSSMVYVGSTLRVEVGSAWLKAPAYTFGSQCP